MPSSRPLPLAHPAPGGAGLSNRALLARLRRGVARVPLDGPPLPPVPPNVVPRRGAVLVLLYPRAGRAHVALTRRPAGLRSHSGEISLPGGRQERGDATPLATALRETWEELGVSAAGLTVWGQLRPVYVRASNYLIRPFVAYRRRRPRFRPSPSEVAELLEVPLAALLDRATHEEEVWLLRGELRRVAYFRFGEHKIWGATARILAQLVHLALGEPTAAEANARLVPGQVV